MGSNEMVLQCMIFRIDFERDFTLLDKRGFVATEMDKSKLFDEIRLSADGLSVGCAKSEPYTVINFFPDNVNGRFEKPSLSIEEISQALKFTSRLFNSVQIKTANIKRAGVRFFFLREEEKFEQANEKSLLFFSEKLLSLIEEKSKSSESSVISDSLYSMVFSSGGHSVRLAGGPVKRDEYRKFFEKPALTEIENACMVDIDYFVTQYDYKEMHLIKFVEEGLKEASRIAKSVFERTI